MDMVMDDKILKVMRYEEIYGILKNKGVEETLEVVTLGKPDIQVVK
jgi:hypothetical protein